MMTQIPQPPKVKSIRMPLVTSPIIKRCIPRAPANQQMINKVQSISAARGVAASALEIITSLLEICSETGNDASKRH